VSRSEQWQQKEKRIQTCSAACAKT
jgi:hypothetical protein